ncbi:MAG: hypothetical protein DBX37_02435 [Massilioclostridium sp.]|nr:MAG: hypothetical protein DBX37_02435 [Massilioclostridium sp.]
MVVFQYPYQGSEQITSLLVVLIWLNKILALLVAEKFIRFKNYLVNSLFSRNTILEYKSTRMKKICFYQI